MTSALEKPEPPFVRGLGIGGLILVCASGFLLGWSNSWAHQTSNLANISLGLALASLGISSCTPGWRLPISTWGALLLSILSLYLLFSITMNVGTINLKGQLETNNPIWWGNYAKICFAAACLGLSFRSERAILLGIGSFCFGSFSVAVLFSVDTIVATGKTVYGAINNPLDGVVINSAGVMSLAIFLPAFISALAFYRPLLARSGYWVIVIATYAAASWIGFAFNSRSVFLFLYGGLLVQMLTMVALNCPKDRKSLLLVFAGVAVFLALVITVFLHLRRPVSGQLLTDPRFGMVQTFACQIFEAPFAHARVPIAIQIRAESHYFHNFFADADRLSGFLSFLFATVLAGLVGVATLWSALVGPAGRVLLFSLLPTFLILNTSVVPEGEFQPIALLLLIGGAALGILQSRRVGSAPACEP